MAETNLSQFILELYVEGRKGQTDTQTCVSLRLRKLVGFEIKWFYGPDSSAPRRFSFRQLYSSLLKGARKQPRHFYPQCSDDY